MNNNAAQVGYKNPVLQKESGGPGGEDPKKGKRGRLLRGKASVCKAKR